MNKNPASIIEKDCNFVCSKWNVNERESDQLIAIKEHVKLNLLSRVTNMLSKIDLLGFPFNILDEMFNNVQLQDVTRIFNKLKYKLEIKDK